MQVFVPDGATGRDEREPLPDESEVEARIDLQEAKDGDEDVLVPEAGLSQGSPFEWLKPETFSSNRATTRTKLVLHEVCCHDL